MCHEPRPMVDHAEFRVEILKKEMDICATKVNHFDHLRLRTRQTGIALWTAVLGFGLKEDVSGLFALAVILPLPFWILDGRYRRYQRGWGLRLRSVQDFVRDGQYKVRGDVVATLASFLDGKDTSFPAIDFWARRTVSEDEHRKETSLTLNFLNPNHLMIYVPMCLIAMVLTIWSLVWGGGGV